MTVEWKPLLDNFGAKRVTKTDKKKSAYVLNKEQRRAFVAAGVKPESGATFDVVVLFDPTINRVTASYYHSQRVGSGRAAEYRMGQGIVAWLDEDDVVVIGNVGRQVFAFKQQHSPASIGEVAAEILRNANRKAVMDRAKRASGKPLRRTVPRQEFVRNPYVVAGALARSDGRCEMPGCASALFKRDDGSPYLEVHHVMPLGEKGDDTLVNVAALCPRCHRLLHFGNNRKTCRAVLATHIASLPV